MTAIRCEWVFAFLALAGCATDDSSRRPPMAAGGPAPYYTPAQRQGGPYYGQQPPPNYGQAPYYGGQYPQPGPNPGAQPYPFQPAPTQPPPAAQPPFPGQQPAPIVPGVRKFTVEIVTATISASKAGSDRPWDGVGRIPPEAVQKVRDALLKTGNAKAIQAAVAIALADLANRKFDPPDVAGDVQLYIGGMPTGPAQLLAKQQDDYLPTWRNPARFTGLTLDDSVRIRVHLVDKDAGSMFGFETDDEIGIVMLNANHLRAAAASGVVEQIRTDDQNVQLLFVGINVMPEQ